MATPQPESSPQRSAPAAQDAERVEQLEQQLAQLQESHQLELDHKAELLSTVEMGRSLLQDAEVATRAAEERASHAAELEEMLNEARGLIRRREEAREGERRELERLREQVADGPAAEIAEMLGALQQAESVAIEHGAREEELIAEITAVKRELNEARKSGVGAEGAVVEANAHVVSLRQQMDAAEAAAAPMRQQLDETKEQCRLSEEKLAKTTDELAASEAERSRLKADAQRLAEENGALEARLAGGEAAEAESRLAQAQAEIAGWASRQQLLLGQLASERDAGRERAAALTETRDQLANVRQVLLASKDEQLVDSFEKLRAKENECGELERRSARMGEQISTLREELKLRAEQQRLVTEKLKACEESLRAREAAIVLRDEVARTQELRAEDAVGRMHASLTGAKETHVQLAEAQERVALLTQEIEAARAREQLAHQKLSTSADEVAEMRAADESRLARAEAAEERLRAASVAQLEQAHVIEQRDAELRALRAELAKTHGKLAEYIESELRAGGA